MSKAAQLGGGGSENLTPEWRSTPSGRLHRGQNKVPTDPEGREFPCASSSAGARVNWPRELWKRHLLPRTKVLRRQAAVYPIVLVRQKPSVPLAPVGRKSRSWFGGKRIGSACLSNRQASFLSTAPDPKCARHLSKHPFKRRTGLTLRCLLLSRKCLQRVRPRDHRPAPLPCRGTAGTSKVRRAERCSSRLWGKRLAWTP